MNKQARWDIGESLRFWLGSVAGTVVYASLLALAHRLAIEGYGAWVLGAFVLCALCAVVVVSACVVSKRSGAA